MADMRWFMEKLDKLGELKTIDAEVDWKLEAGAIAGMNQRVSDGKHALWMRNIKGYPGMSQLWCLWVSPRRQAWRRMAIAMDLDPDMDWYTFQETLLDRFAHPIKPIEVTAAGAPCKENIMMGEDVNLFKFPFALIHGIDGARFQTMMTQCVKDPDTGWVNWGQYRFQLLTRNKMTGLQLAGQHGPTIYYLKYEARGQDMPFAFMIGYDPLVFVASTMAQPAGVWEAEIAGAMRGAPLELVRCETNDLLVDANAEIVIEGIERPYERADEGPFGEYQGYAHGRVRSPVYRVTCITHRNNPILPIVNEGMFVTDTACVGASTFGVAALENIRRTRPDWPIASMCNLISPSWSLVVISTDVPYPGYKEDLVHYLFSHKMMILAQHIILVDADVNPADGEQVWREIFLKVNPMRDWIFTDEDVINVAVDATVSLRERQYFMGAAKMVIDATTPKEWDRVDVPKKAGVKELYERGYLDKLYQEWKEVVKA